MNSLTKKELMRVCEVCKKKDPKEGWCPNCGRCWDCIGGKCERYSHKMGNEDGV